MSKWIENNEIMRRDELGQLSLSKDKEAIELYLEHIKSKTKTILKSDCKITLLSRRRLLH